MTQSAALQPLPDPSAIVAQEAPLVNGRVFVAAGLGAVLSGVMILLGSNNPAHAGSAVFALAPMVPAASAVLLWASLKFTEKTPARRQTVSAAGVLAIVAAAFYLLEWSARFELSLFFALMLFAWGSRLKFAQLMWAALPYLAVSILLRVFGFPGEAMVLLALGALTMAWPLVAQARASWGQARA